MKQFKPYKKIMKKNLSVIAIATLMLVAGSTITSCKKKDATTTNTTATTPDTNTNSAKDHQNAENNSNDVDQMGAEGIDNGNLNSNYKLTGGTGGLLSPLSGSITVIANAASKSVTLTFLNYMGLDGHLRTGSLTYDYSATILTTATNFRDSGIVINVSSSNYYVDSNKIQVSKTITNLGRDLTSHNLTWHILSNIIITKTNNGGTIQLSSDRYNTLLNTNSISYNNVNITASFSGYIVPINWSTAVIGITNGPTATTGTSSDNIAFTANISTMLVRNFGCSPASLPLLHPHFHPFIAGQIDFTPTGKTTRNINFGTGTCDETYTITIGNWSATFTYIM
jgi:hypothetical protein